MAFSPRLCRAFSLVEVTMAIGLISFCLVSLLALLPTGLNAIQDAGNQLTGMRIVENISSSAQRVPFADLETFCSGSHSFDNDGVPTTTDTQFTATIAPSTLSLPGDQGNQSATKKLQIEISPRNSQSKTRFTIVISQRDSYQ